MTPNDAKDEVRLNICLRGNNATILKKLSQEASVKPGQFAKILLCQALALEAEA